MSNKLNVTIPIPCHENWASMTTIPQGRFCQVCTKTVIDFTTMSDDKIIKVINDNNGKELCGKFHNSQLNRTLIPLQTPKWYNATVWKYILTGTIMFSVLQSNAQQNAASKMPMRNATSTKVSTNETVSEISPSINKHKPNAKLFEVDIMVVNQSGVLLTGVKFNIMADKSIVTFNKKTGYKIRTNSKIFSFEVSKLGYETLYFEQAPEDLKIVLKAKNSKHFTMGKISATKQ